LTRDHGRYESPKYRKRIIAESDDEYIGERVNILETTVEPGDEQDPGHVEPFA
jgi:hypothetical protein